MLSINTNIPSLTAARYLGAVNSDLNDTLTKLSTGKRINSARDDVAGLSISTIIDSTVRGLNIAIRNANDGVSLTQVAEGSLTEVTSILQRMRDLSVSAANGVTADGGVEKTAQDNEAAALSAEIDRIATQTRYGSQVLMDGSFGTVNLQVGANAGETLAITLNDMQAATLGVDAAALDLTTAAGASAAITAIDTALASVAAERGAIGVVQNRLDFAISNLQNVAENSTAAYGRIVDADIAMLTANLSKSQVLQQAATAVMAQANAAPQLALALLG